LTLIEAVRGNRGRSAYGNILWGGIVVVIDLESLLTDSGNVLDTLP
jgi:hypothetical protein